MPVTEDTPLALFIHELQRDYIERLKQIQRLNYELRISQEESNRQIEEFLFALLESFDSYDKMIDVIDAALDSDDKKAKRVLRNFVSLRKDFAKVLKQFGMVRMEIGTEFVPGLHKAVETEPAQEIPEGNIVRVVRHGYYWRNKVLRPAEVVVAAPVDE